VLLEQATLVDGLDQPIYDDIAIAQSVLLGHADILEVAQDLCPRRFVLFLLILECAGRDSLERCDAFLSVPAFVVVLQPLQCLEYEHLVVVDQGVVEAVQHRHAGREPVAQRLRLGGVPFHAVPCALALRVEAVVVREELVELLQHVNAWLVRFFELLLLVHRDFVELVVDVLEEVRKAAGFGCQALVLARAVATCLLLASTSCAGQAMTQYNSCRPVQLSRIS
jgi:hypothetical protein